MCLEQAHLQQLTAMELHVKEGWQQKRTEHELSPPTQELYWDTPEVRGQRWTPLSFSDQRPVSTS